MLRLAIAFLLVLGGTIQLAWAQSLANQMRGRASVIDGDTIEISGARIRLHGIDAPETGQTCNNRRGGTWACGTDAATMLSDLIGGREVVCTRTAANDTYGRIIATCRAGDRNLNAELVSRGLAWAYREYSNAFNACEADAKNLRVGIWQAQSQAPWDYRRDAWNDALQVAPAGKPIKGNFRAKGGCVYHTPWSRSYRSVKKMDPPNQWFADEAEATKVGCRPATHSAPFRIIRRVSRGAPASSTCPTP